VEGRRAPQALRAQAAARHIEKGLVLRKLGRLEDEDRQALQGVLDEILGR